MTNFQNRFWAKVSRSESCWEWTASLDGSGYGWFSVSSRMLRAHRVSWEIAFGEIPGRLQVLHRCDNRRCVNPNHLFLGTNSDNIADRMSKGRKSGASGSRNGRSKLSEQSVSEIKSQLEKGLTQADIAKAHGVSQSCISYIAIGQHWNAVRPKQSECCL